VKNKSVTTLEGLGSTKKLHKIQQAFIDEQALQCGYCINGMIMAAKALLDKNPQPSDAQIKQALAGAMAASPVSTGRLIRSSDFRTFQSSKLCS
jgi:aerobic-type carbon monoxide dehydrogenase small subunit (CoxS/CutS family)